MIGYRKRKWIVLFDPRRSQGRIALRSLREVRQTGTVTQAQQVGLSDMPPFPQTMRAITCDAIFTRFASRVDGSMSATLTTPELATDEKVALMELHGKNVKLLIQPNDETPEAMVQVKGVLDFKTPSQRLRGVLFLEWKEKKLDYSFDEFYAREMEHIIEGRKQRLEQV